MRQQHLALVGVVVAVVLSVVVIGVVLESAAVGIGSAVVGGITAGLACWLALGGRRT